MREIYKLFIPPIINKFARRFVIKQPRGADFIGDYNSYAEALRNSAGYNHPDILEQVTRASLKVKNGEAAFERDSVVFATPAFSFPLLASLLRVRALHNGRLSVLDFGGSLGSTYYPARHFFAELKDVHWSIVEQASFVEIGHRLFETDQLHFYDSVDECEEKQRPNVIIFSGALGYIEDPYAVLREICRLSACHLILDRTAFISAPRDRITVQRVPDRIYKASYPARLFGSGLLPVLAENWKIIAEWQALDGSVESSAGLVHHKGFAMDSLVEKRSC